MVKPAHVVALSIVLGGACIGWMLAAPPQAIQEAPRRVVTPADSASGNTKRVALVVGNNAYPQMRLANSVNDARGRGAFYFSSIPPANEENIFSSIRGVCFSPQASDPPAQPDTKKKKGF